MCPEMCKFCNEIALAGVSGSFPRLILASVLKFVFWFWTEIFELYRQMRHLPFNKCSSVIFLLLCCALFFYFGRRKQSVWSLRFVKFWRRFSSKTQRHGALFNMLRFQSIQSKFSFKLYVLNSKRFHAMLLCILSALTNFATERVFFAGYFLLPFFEEKKGFRLASSLTRSLTIFVGLRIWADSLSPLNQSKG